jgi:hypothetical protein
MFKVAVAHSLELDSSEAVADVLEQCREQLEDLEPQAGLLFAGIDHDFAHFFFPSRFIMIALVGH